jgi:anthranilate synthase component 2
MHGKISAIRHRKGGLYEGLPDPFIATRYHSLVVAPESLPGCLEVNAWTEDGAIMGFAHRLRPLHGVQFHPESIATQGGHRLLANFLDLAGVARLEVA